MSLKIAAGAALLRVALIALGCGMAGALAQGLVPAEIPDTLQEALKLEFEDKRTGLDKRRAQLGAAVSQQNARCRGLPEDSPLVD